MELKFDASLAQTNKLLYLQSAHSGIEIHAADEAVVERLDLQSAHSGIEILIKF